MYEYVLTKNILTNIQKRIKSLMEIIDEMERAETLDVLALAELEQMGENAKYGFAVKMEVGDFTCQEEF